MSPTNGAGAPSVTAATTAGNSIPTTTGTTPKAVTIGLSVTQTCSTADTLAPVVANLVAQRFAMSTPTKTALEKDLKKYFDVSGITNEEVFSFMVDPSSWPDYSKLGPRGSPLKSITVPVTLLMSQLAKYCQTMLKEKYFLTANVTFSDFQAWVLSLAKSAPSVAPSAAPSSAQDKIPSFKVPLFRGDSLAGDKYMDDVVRAFTSNAMAQYLDDVKFCMSHPTWSGAFASRLRESIADSSILGFIATEAESETNSATLWAKIKKQLTSADLQMARAMAHWNILFGLKCEEKDSFLEFYSQAKSIIFKLKRDKSVAIGDDIFLRAYFAKVIEAPELQTEVKKLISDKNGTYESILELIHKDYRAQETGDALRDVNPSSQTTAVRRARPEPPVPSGNAADSEEPPLKRPRLPKNEDGLLPPHFYVQFRDWYNHMIVPKKDRTAEDLAWMRNFRFDFSRPSSSRPSHSRKDSDKPPHDRDSGGYRDKRRDHDGRRDEDRRSRRGVNDDTPCQEVRFEEYEDFLAWRNSHNGKRGRDSSSDPNDSAPRGRRASMFRLV